MNTQIKNMMGCLVGGEIKRQAKRGCERPWSASRWKGGNS